MSTPSLEWIKETTEKIDRFVEWLAEAWRSGGRAKKLLIIDLGLFVVFNPVLLTKFSPLLPFKLELPSWYPLSFGVVIGLVFIAAVIVAIRTRKVATPGDLTEHKALKFLLPFRFEDAETFKRLQREESLRECLLAITDPEFRYGILWGDSGCGKTSFLQAGLWLALLKYKVPHHCIYVKFTDKDPLESVHQALAKKFPLPQENAERGNLLTLFGKVAPSGSQPLVLLFDQFEQFFVHRKRKEDQKPFVQALGEWYKSESPLPVKIVISLREDFLHHLIRVAKGDGLRPPGPQQMIPLENFTAKEATVIFRVIAETEDLPFDEGFVEELAEKELASREDSSISAVDLQILAWTIKGRRTEEERAFNRTVFRKLGGLEGLLEHFLSRSLRVLETETQRPAAIKVLLALTDLKRSARAGVRTPEQIEELAGNFSTKDIQEALDWLAGARLITPVETDTAQGYELAHERLIPALRRLARKELSEAEQARQLLDRRVYEWLDNDRARRYLLTWRELRRIHRQKPYFEWGANKDHKEALIAQSGRQLHWRAGGSALAVLLAISSLGWWYSPWGQIWLAEQDLKG